MSLVGLDGQKIASTDAEAEAVAYEVGGICIDAVDTPETTLQKALEGARQMVGQQVGQMALQRTGSEVVAVTEAQAAASKVTNPFQIEPCALALFMLMAREIEHRDGVMSALAARLDALDGNTSDELLKKSWSKPQVQDSENEGDSEGKE